MALMERILGNVVRWVTGTGQLFELDGENNAVDILGTLKLAGTQVTPSAADLNTMLGAAGNGLVVADVTKLAAVNASAAELDAADISAKCTLVDDFDGDVLDDGWGSASGTDPQVVAPAINVQVGGVCRMVTGDDGAVSMAANGVQLHRALTWKAANGGLVFETRLKVDDITTVCLFAGLTNQVAALEMPFVLGAADALTATAEDAVGFLFDTAADTDKFFGVGSKASTGVKQASTVAPVNATFITLRVEISAAGAATFYINGTAVGEAVADAVTAATALTPVVAAFARAAASRTVDVDYVFVQQARA